MTVPLYSSIESIGDQIGTLIERHMELAFRAMLRGPYVDFDKRFVRVVTGGPHPFANFAILSAPDDQEATETAIEKLIAGGAPAAMIFPGPPATRIAEWLHARGFHPHDSMPAMAVDIAKLPSTTLPGGYAFARIGADSSGGAWAECFAKGYELPLELIGVFSPLVTVADPAPDASIQFFAVLRGSRLVNTSVLYLGNGVAGIYCVATLPEERGKRLAAHATAEPLRLAQALGYRVGVLQSSPAGHALYRRLGFAEFGALHLFVNMTT